MSRLPSELQLSGHELLDLHYRLELQLRGIPMGRDSAVTLLNQRTHRQWNARQWMAVLRPHYDAMVAPSGDHSRRSRPVTTSSNALF